MEAEKATNPSPRKKRISKVAKTISTAAFNELKNMLDETIEEKAILKKQNEFLDAEIKKSAEMTKTAVQGLETLITQTVPKAALKEESLLTRIQLYLEGKGSWVKTVVTISLMIMSATIGVGADQLIGYLYEGQVFVSQLSDILTGLLTGSGIGILGLANIFRKPKKFDPKTDANFGLDGSVVLNK